MGSVHWRRSVISCFGEIQVKVGCCSVWELPMGNLGASAPTLTS